ncbi:MAG: alkaline phosphatase family protein [Elusimicrobiota bacterium]
MSNKFIIIGLDGATFDLIGKWIDSADLSNLKRIKDSGYTSILESTIPFHSAPAWNSMTTGVNPGRHGIFDFFQVKDKKSRVISSKSRKSQALWNIMDDFDKKTVVINIPCTYPPEQIKGKMITGMLTPSKKSIFTYPPELKKELGNYNLDSWWKALPFLVYASNKKKRLSRITNNIIDERFDVLEHLIRDGKWDVSFLVVRILDHLQHYLWDEKEILFDAYKRVDKNIGELIKKYPRANFLIVSDHGFKSAEYCFYVNNFLFNKGYIRPNNKYWEFILKFKGYLTGNIGKISKKTLSLIDLDSLTKIEKIKNLLSKMYFNKTEKGYIMDAFSFSASSCGIWIYKKEIKEKLTEQLKNLSNPYTGKKVIKKIYHREELFKGKYVNQAPDIIYILNDDYTMSNMLFGKGGIFNKKQPEFSYSREYGHTGEHSRQGILMAYGPGIKKFSTQKNSIMDILPTVIYGMDMGMIENSDGKVIEMFKEKHKDNKIFIKEIKSEDKSKKYSEDENILRQRLKNLGYLG